jgi:CRISPR/Cas system-associated exonuclease Cas4 (RecB family)
MTDLVNKFSWSASRDKIATMCPRAYYWRHYGSWGGWEHSAPERAQLAYTLKNMTGLDAWVGDVTHAVISNALTVIRRYGHKPSPAADLCEHARQLLIREWFESVDKAWKGQPKKARNLLEHYYNRAISRERREELREKVFLCLRNWHASAIRQEILAVGPNGWCALEDMLTFDVDGTPVYAQPDFMLKPSNLPSAKDELIIYDWKTGKPRPEDEAQMMVYSLLAEKRFECSTPEVVLVYLKTGAVVRKHPTAAERAETLERIRASIARLKSLCRNPEKNEAVIDDFPLNPGRQCDRCEYFELCEPILKAQPAPVPAAAAEAAEEEEFEL